MPVALSILNSQYCSRHGIRLQLHPTSEMPLYLLPCFDGAPAQLDSGNAVAHTGVEATYFAGIV
jgi:hypothetical protein